MTGVPPGSTTSKIIQKQQQAQQELQAMEESATQQQTAHAAAAGKGKKGKGKKGKGKKSSLSEESSAANTPGVSTPTVATNEEDLDKQIGGEGDSHTADSTHLKEESEAHDEEKKKSDAEKFTAAALPHISIDTEEEQSSKLTQQSEDENVGQSDTQAKIPEQEAPEPEKSVEVHKPSPAQFEVGGDEPLVSNTTHDEISQVTQQPAIPIIGNIEETPVAACQPSTSTHNAEEQEKPAAPVTTEAESINQPPAPKNDNVVEEAIDATPQAPIGSLSSKPNQDEASIQHTEHQEGVKAGHKPPRPKVEDVEDEAPEEIFAHPTFQTPAPNVHSKAEQPSPVDKAEHQETFHSDHQLPPAHVNADETTNLKHAGESSTGVVPDVGTQVSPTIPGTSIPTDTASSAQHTNPIPVSTGTHGKEQKMESTTPNSSPPKENFLGTPHITNPETINPAPIPHAPVTSQQPVSSEHPAVSGTTGHILDNQEVLAALHHNKVVAHDKQEAAETPSPITHQTPAVPAPQIPAVHYPPVLAAPAETPVSVIASHHKLPTSTPPAPAPPVLHAPHYQNPPAPGVHPGAGVCAGGIVTSHPTSGIIQNPTFPAPLHPSPYLSNVGTYRQDPTAAELSSNEHAGQGLAGAEDSEGMGFLKKTTSATAAAGVAGTPVTTSGYHRRGGDDVGLVASLFNFWERSKTWWEDLFDRSGRR